MFLCIANTADPSLLFNRRGVMCARALVKTTAVQFKPFPRILGIQLCTQALGNRAVTPDQPGQPAENPGPS